RAETVAVVVRLDFDLETLAGGIVHHVVEPAELGGIERAELAALHALPQERQPDDAHAFGGVVVDLGMRGIGVVGAEDAGDIRTELGPREIHTEKKRAGHWSLTSIDRRRPGN